MAQVIAVRGFGVGGVYRVMLRELEGGFNSGAAAPRCRGSHIVSPMRWRAASTAASTEQQQDGRIRLRSERFHMDASCCPKRAPTE